MIEVWVLRPLAPGCVVCACLTQDMPVPAFRTTVVGNVGLRGIVYYLKPNTGVLPDSFRRFKPKGVIYTRSLNVTPRFFKEGFPGVTKRVEWFAIDYLGKFWVEKAGLLALPLIQNLGVADSNKFIDRLEQLFPQLKDSLEKKRPVLPTANRAESGK